MLMLSAKQVARQLPQGAAQISLEWASSVVCAIAPGFCVTGGGKSFPLTKTATHAQTIGKWGLEFGVVSESYSDLATRVLNKEDVQSSGRSEQTTIIFYRRFSGSTTAPVIYQEDTNSGYFRDAFCYETGNWVWRTRGTSSGDTGDSENMIVTSPISGAFECRAFVFSSGKKQAYLNGKPDRSTTSPSTAYTSTPATGFSFNGVIFGDNSANYGSNSRIALFLRFNRALSSKEIASIYANPAQVIRAPDSRIFVPTGAGIVTNLIALGVAVISAYPNAVQFYGAGSLGASQVGCPGAQMQPSGVLSTASAGVSIAPKQTQALAALELAVTTVETTAHTVQYILGILGNLVQLGVATMAVQGRAIRYSVAGVTYVVVPKELMHLYTFNRVDKHVGVLRDGTVLLFV